MKPELKKRWVEALRSGKYTQVIGSLRNRNGFCCLGVACEVFKEDVGLMCKDPIDIGYPYGYDEEETSLPLKLQEFLEISRDGELKTLVSCVDNLVDLNDDVKFTFNQIADVIEEQF